MDFVLKTNFYDVLVIPESKPNLYFDKTGNRFIVCVRSKAENGKANEELMKIFKKEYNLEQIKIVQGKNQRKKSVYLKFPS